MITRGLIVIAAAFLLFKAVSLAAADLLAQSFPSAALWLSSGHTEARLAYARELLQASELEEDPQPLRLEAIEQIRKAIKADPFAPGGLALLAQVSGEAMPDDERQRLMALALKINQRDLTAQVWLLNRELKNGRAEAAADRVRQIFKGQLPQTAALLAPELVPVMLSPALRPHIVGWFVADEKSRLDLLPRIAQNAPNLADLATFYQALRETPARPGTELSRPFMERLIKEGFVDEAYNYWLQILPMERLARLGFLYNASFQYPVTNVPFDWVFANTPGFLAEVAPQDGRRILNVDFFGSRIDFRHVSHLTRLPSGRYTLSGLVRTLGLENEVGLRWRVHCLNGEQTTLGASESWKGTFGWKPFQLSFQVGEGCKYQNLVLELPKRVALDTVITGGVSFTNIALNADP